MQQAIVDAAILAAAHLVRLIDRIKRPKRSARERIAEYEKAANVQSRRARP